MATPAVPLTTDAVLALKYFKGNNLDITMLGCVPDCILVSDGATVAGNPVITCATSTPFTKLYVGKVLAMQAYDGSNILVTTVKTFISTSQVTLAAAPGFSAQNMQIACGTDNAANIAKAVAECLKVGRPFNMVAGQYLTTQTFDVQGQLSIRGIDKDNSCAAQLIYVGTGVGMFIHNPVDNTPIFAVNIEHFSIITFGGATDGIVAKRMLASNWRHFTINDFWGSSVNGLRLWNSGINCFQDYIITKASNALVKFQSDFPGFDVTDMTFEEGQLYQGQITFDFSGSTPGNIKISKMFVEQFNTFCNCDMTTGGTVQVMVIKSVTFENIWWLTGTDVGPAGLGYINYPDPVVARLKGGFILAQPFFHCTGLRFINSVLFCITRNGSNDAAQRVVNNPFRIDLSGSTLALNCSLYIDSFQYTGVKTGLIQSIKTSASQQMFIYTKQIELGFDDGVPLFDPADAADHRNYDKRAFWVCPGIDWIIDSLQIKTDGDISGGQFFLGNKVFSHAMRFVIPPSGSTSDLMTWILYGALGALAINARAVAVGTDEVPPFPRTLYVHRNSGSNTTSVHIVPGSADLLSNILMHIGASYGGSGLQFAPESILIKADPGVTYNGQFVIGTNDFSRAFRISVPPTGAIASLIGYGGITQLAIPNSVSVGTTAVAGATLDVNGTIRSASLGATRPVQSNASLQLVSASITLDATGQVSASFANNAILQWDGVGQKVKSIGTLAANRIVETDASGNIVAAAALNAGRPMRTSPTTSLPTDGNIFLGEIDSTSTANGNILRANAGIVAGIDENTLATNLSPKLDYTVIPGLTAYINAQIATAIAATATAGVSTGSGGAVAGAHTHSQSH
ncbi:MAG: hypothetical protein NVS1B6_01160 [Steroidobacteraceae bacterium]